jgi:hypothetical protein
VTSDRSTIHLRCVRCGHRSAGWQLGSRSPAFQAAHLWQRPAIPMARRQPS